MARIIYKEGREGQNRLECIEGVEIDMLNGQCALIYPKYANLQLLTDDKIAFWDAKRTSEIEALKKDENLWATGVLLKCGSPAAQYVSNFRSDKHSIFGLPTLLAAMEIQGQRNNIDALAVTIEGADLLRNHTSGVWSCSRFGDYEGWVANLNNGFANYNDLSLPVLAVPVVLYR
jgi:hypothetical protein